MIFKKGGTVLCICSNPIVLSEQWYLKSIRNFVERKLAIGKCAKCGEYALVLSEKRNEDGKTFVQYINGIEALKVAKRETKRVLNRTFINNDTNVIGWVYGVNVEIKNKKGKIVQIRQYASDFSNNKTLAKKIYVKE